eukprot:1954838-Rhodomonas_salina.1
MVTLMRRPNVPVRGSRATCPRVHGASDCQSGSRATGPRVHVARAWSWQSGAPRLIGYCSTALRTQHTLL